MVLAQPPSGPPFWGTPLYNIFSWNFLRAEAVSHARAARDFLLYDHSKHVFSMHLDSKSNLQCSPQMSHNHVQLELPRDTTYTHIVRAKQTCAHPQRGKRPLLFFRIFGRVPPAQHVSAKPCGAQSRTGTVPMRQPGCTCSGGADPLRLTHTHTRVITCPPFYSRFRSE